MSEERGVLGTIFGAAWAGFKGGWGGYAGLFAQGVAQDKSHSITDYLKVGMTSAFNSWANNIVSGGKHGGFVEGMATGATTGYATGDTPVDIVDEVKGMVGGSLEERAVSKVTEKLGL